MTFLREQSRTPIDRPFKRTKAWKTHTHDITNHVHSLEKNLNPIGFLNKISPHLETSSITTPTQGRSYSIFIGWEARGEATEVCPIQAVMKKNSYLTNTLLSESKNITHNTINNKHTRNNHTYKCWCFAFY